MTKQGSDKELAEHLERSVILTGGEKVDAPNSQGLVYKPSGPVKQTYVNIHLGESEGTAELVRSYLHGQQGSLQDGSLRPYLRTIESQEKVISQYKTATENRVKSALDDAADLINIHQLKRAVTLLERIRDEELLDLPSMDTVDPLLQASVYRLLGICYLRLNDPDTAYDYVETARSILSESEQIDRALLEYYLVIDDQIAAAEVAQRLLDQDDNCMAAQHAFAIIHLRQEEFAGIADFYRDIPAADEDPVAQSILFYAHMQLGNVSLALKHALNFAKLEPDLPQAYETLGNGYFAMAYRALDKQIAVYADWYSGLIDKVYLDKAIQAYQKAHKLYRKRDQEYISEALWINLATALARIGRLQDALRIVNKSLENLSSPNVYYYELKAQIQEELGDLDSALATCQDAVEHFPDDAHMKINLAGLYLNRRELSAARLWLDQAEAVCRDARTLLLIQIIRTKTFLLENNSELAWNALQRIPEDYRDSVDTALATGDYFTHFKHHAKAEAWFQRALAREPQNLVVLHKVTAFYRSVQRLDEALIYAERIAGLAATPETRAGYAELLLQANRPADALVVLKEIDTGDGETTYRKLLRAMCLQQLRKFSEAIPLYVEVLDDDSENFTAQFNLALCHTHLSQRRESIAALNFGFR